MLDEDVADRRGGAQRTERHLHAHEHMPLWNVRRPTVARVKRQRLGHGGQQRQRECHQSSAVRSSAWRPSNRCPGATARWFSRPDQFLDLLRREWPAEMITLHLIGVIFAQERELIVGLDALGDEPQIELLSQGNHGAGDDLRRNALAARRASSNSMCRGQLRNRRMPAFPGCASSANTSARASTSGRLTVGMFQPGAPLLPRSIRRCGAAASPLRIAGLTSTTPIASPLGYRALTMMAGLRRS